jgi:hypothetical protein
MGPLAMGDLADSTLDIDRKEYIHLDDPARATSVLADQLVEMGVTDRE